MSSDGNHLIFQRKLKIWQPTDVTQFASNKGFVMISVSGLRNILLWQQVNHELLCIIPSADTRCQIGEGQLVGDSQEELDSAPNTELSSRAQRSLH